MRRHRRPRQGGRRHIDVLVREGHMVGVVGESGSRKTTPGLALVAPYRASEGESGSTASRCRACSFKGLRARCAPGRCRSSSRIRSGPWEPADAVSEIIADGPEWSHGIARHRGRQREPAESSIGWDGGRPLDPAGRHRLFRTNSPAASPTSGSRYARRDGAWKPRFVVLDEPNSALDMSVQPRSSISCATCRAGTTSPTLFISHRPEGGPGRSRYYILVMKGRQGGRAGPRRPHLRRAVRNPYHPGAFQGEPLLKLETAEAGEVAT